MPISDETMIKVLENIARIENEDLPDSELQQKVLRNAQKAQLTSDYGTLTKLIGEQRACKAILDERAELRKKVEDARKKWVSSADRHKADAFLNLRNSASANGQLIAAILEEEGKSLTMEEISNWCDELSSLTDTEVKDLLSGLVKEGVLSLKKDKKYHLVQICTPDLYPENRLQWALDKLNTKLSTTYRHQDDCKNLIAVLHLLDEKDTPLAGIDILDSYKKSRTWKKYAAPDSDSGFKVQHSVFCHYLDELYRFGILTRRSTNHSYNWDTVYVYFFPMLGDTEVEK